MWREPLGNGHPGRVMSIWLVFVLEDAVKFFVEFFLSTKIALRLFLIWLTLAPKVRRSDGAI